MRMEVVQIAVAGFPLGQARPLGYSAIYTICAIPPKKRINWKRWGYNCGYRLQPHKVVKERIMPMISQRLGAWIT